MKTTNTKKNTNTEPTYPQKRALAFALMHSSTYGDITSKIDQISAKLGKKSKESTYKPSKERLKGKPTANQCFYLVNLLCEGGLTNDKASEFIKACDKKSGYKRSAK